MLRLFGSKYFCINISQVPFHIDFFFSCSLCNYSILFILKIKSDKTYSHVSNCNRLQNLPFERSIEPGNKLTDPCDPSSCSGTVIVLLKSAVATTWNSKLERRQTKSFRRMRINIQDTHKFDFLLASFLKLHTK